eukprot:m.11989 g.11989  ORF g.11989 m.11989 type:complete len:1111 (+) comp9093_c0_seq1:65-3397(+)
MSSSRHCVFQRLHPMNTCIYAIVALHLWAVLGDASHATASRVDDIDPDPSWNLPSMTGSLPILDLCGGEWTFEAESGPGLTNFSHGHGVAGRVPGDVYTDLQRAGAISDPLQPFGDWKTAWVGKTGWRYFRTFVVDDSALRSAEEALLVFEGLSTNATVTINGQPVSATNNSWMTYAFSLKPGLLIPASVGDNVVSITFASVYDSCEFSDPRHANITCPNRVFVRQAASSWGWDWVKRYSPVGISRPIYIAFVPKQLGAAITAMGVITRSVPARTAVTLPNLFTVEAVVTIFVSAAAASSTSPSSTLQVQLQGSWAENSTQSHTLPSMHIGLNKVRIQMSHQVSDVNLWWPVGYGSQNLYKISATLMVVRVQRQSREHTQDHAVSKMNRAVGFRTVRLQTDWGKAVPGGSSGSGNSSMVLIVNGVKIFVRGSSLVPFHSFPGRMTAAAAVRLLQSTVAANMNSLRVWGGGDYLPPAFYDLADEAGILLMHDFMLTWYPGNPYPADPIFLQRIADEVEQKVVELERHPSIVMWNGNNEDQCSRYDPARSDSCTGVNWYRNCSQVYADCISVYINTVLATAAKWTAIPLWPSSPSAGWASGVDTATGVPDVSPLVGRGNGVSSPTRPSQGALDVHGPYGSSCEAGSLRRYESGVLFHSEFGQLSLPQYETFTTVMENTSTPWRTLHSPELAERSPNGAANLQGCIEGTLGKGLVNFSDDSERSFRRVIFLSQLAQSLCLKVTVDGGRLGTAATSVDGHSTWQQRPWGFLFWQLNDIMQGSSWGSLEYGGRFKLAHYAARQWFSPVRVECNRVRVGADSGDVAEMAVSMNRGHTEFPCTFLNNTDFSGPGKVGVPALTANECCTICQTDAQCRAATFAPSGSCWVKYSTDEPVSSPGNTACVATARLPTSAIACTATNDGPVPWSGRVSLHLDYIAPTLTNQTLWTETFDVGPVSTGEAVRFFNANITGPCHLSNVTTDGDGDSTSLTNPCWIYGGDITSPADSTAIGLPLTSLSNPLRTSTTLPPTTVIVTSIDHGVADGGHTVIVSNTGIAAALYVVVTTAVLGQFDMNGIHLLGGQNKTLSFRPWNTFDPTAFSNSLHVHWLNIDLSTIR